MGYYPLENNLLLTFHYTGCLIRDPYVMVYEVIPT